MANVPLSPLILPSAELDGLPAEPLDLAVEGSPRLPTSPSAGSNNGGISPLLLSRGGSTSSLHRRRLTFSPDGTGSALETFSALLLHHEAHGQAAALSRQREGLSTSKAFQEAVAHPAQMLKKLRRHSLPLGPLEEGHTRVGTGKGFPTFEVHSPPFPVSSALENGPDPHPLQEDSGSEEDAPPWSEPADPLINVSSAALANHLVSRSLPGAWVDASSPMPWRPLPLKDRGLGITAPSPHVSAPRVPPKTEPFESILGVHRARTRQAEARKEERRHRARDRPAHQVGMLTALSNFVHAAHAADMAAKAGEKERKRRERENRSIFPSGLRGSLKRNRSHGDAPYLSAPQEQMTLSSGTEFGISKSRSASHRIARDAYRGHDPVQEGASLNPQHVLGLVPRDIGVQLQPGPLETKPSDRGHEGEAGPAFSVEMSGRAFLRWYMLGDLTIPRPTWQSVWTHLPSRAQVILKPLLMLLFPVVAAIWLLLVHTFGLTVFILAHALALALEVWEQLCLAGWFLRWVLANLRGKTVLSRCIIEAHRLVLREWSSVVQEDHEAHEQQQPHHRGLSTWNILRGLLELFCIQDVTWRRLLEHDEGLVPLTRRGFTLDPECSGEIQSWNDELNDDMVVTLQHDDIMQLTRTPRLGPVKEGTADKVPGEQPNRGVWSPTSNVPALLRTLRWAAGLAISAYGMHMPVSGLPPPFTPSGLQLRRQAFAHLSRLKAEAVLHADIQTLDDGATYCPTFYVVKDTARQTIVVAIRGTQSFRDIIVDLEMNASELSLPPSSDARTEETFICHTGILRAAQTLIDPASKLMQILRSELEAEPAYNLVLTGHSLGGAIGSAVAVLLAEYVAPSDGSSEGKWVTSSSSGLPSQRRIRTISFAHPATMSPDLAARAARGSPPLVIAATLGPDIIPRCGHGQARELRRVLGALARLRATHDRDFVEKKAANSPEIHKNGRVPILRTWIKWRWAHRQLRRANPADRPALRAHVEALEQSLWDERCAVEADLYASVKSRRNCRLKDGTPSSPWLGSQPSLHDLSARRQTLDQLTLRNEERIAGAGAPMLIPAGWNVWMGYSASDGDGPSPARAGTETQLDLYYVRSPASFFSLPWLHPKLFAAHFPSAYESAIIDDLPYF